MTEAQPNYQPKQGLPQEDGDPVLFLSGRADKPAGAH